MHRLTSPWIGALALMAFSIDAEAKPVAPTIETLAAYPAMAGFAVSPDGKHIAALEARGEERVILVWRSDALSSPPTVIGTKVMKFQSVSFPKNGVLAVTVWQPYDLKFDTTVKTFVSKLFFTDLEGKTWREPLQLPRPRSEVEELEQSLSSPEILDTLPNDPDHILVVNNVGVEAGDIYKVNVRTGRAERVQRAEEGTFNYQTDLEGRIRARQRLDVNASGGAYVATEIREVGSGAWVEHYRSFARSRDIYAIVGFSKDPNIAFVASNVGRDKVAIYEYDIAARKLGGIAFEHKFFDATGVTVVRTKGENFGEIVRFNYAGPFGDERYLVSEKAIENDRLLVQALGIEETPQLLVDPATGERVTVRMRMGRNWRGVGAVGTSDAENESAVIIRVFGPNEPPSFYLFRNKKELVLLSRTWPGIDPATLGRSSLVYYKARDGLDIPAFLHTPSPELCGPGPWPAVVHPHGGPWARDDMNFDTSMWVPLLVSRCRAVLQPQFRGSADGWGRRLWIAGDAEWGQKMQDDKDDGAKWLIEQQIAIPGRLAMFGFSYGGYAAMAAAVRPNGLYKCAIAGAGVSDIKLIWARFYRNFYFRDAQEPTVRGLNPLDFADRIQIPIYVYHGDRDQIVPIRQSELFVNKAKAARRDVVYREFKDYGHGPAWTRATFGEQLRAIDDYLTKGCGGGGL